ncbi:hypothetical protein IO424_000218 [Campylobacter fetus]|uniref:putative barnase/colicin E5 family endoribonuclease n=1 Tax=Campylobacter fetus TaxID=196 RepID=UPI00056DD855|nr:hypothetical protein [Campylobacter fetus]WKW16667.1 hypothetical protein IXZ25_05160 [Campylobacter fetus subsp. fetus]EAJ5692894.1 hypothetical protein [Campylobacter fetus]EAJ5705028.1 hypothetical protein [Campylobacter fetus]EAJ9256049.1 hypothetical protein [Campylobacter fetus]EAK0814461.1 hypothetical protein [Campylobacter fetus]
MVVEFSNDLNQVLKSDLKPNLNNDVLKGDGFATYPNSAKQTYPYNAFIDIEKELTNELKLPQARIRASLQYLYDKHPEMFNNKRDVYKTIKMLFEFQDYAGNSLKDPNLAYIATKTSDKRMSDMAISRDSNGIIHLNKDKKMSETDKKIFDDKSVVGTTYPQHSQQVTGSQMNTSKEHFSPTNSDIIPQNTKRDGKYPSSQVKAKPIKEFGTNYAEFYHDGSNAIKKLLVEKQGQVAGAFERKELGDIDLVWGKYDTNTGDGYGLSKIIQKHSDFKIEYLIDTIENGVIVQGKHNRINIVGKKGVIVLEKNGSNNWVFNGFRQERTKTALEKLGKVRGENITTVPSEKSLSQTETNADDIISQKAAKSNELSLADNIVSLSNKINDDFKQVSKYLNEYIDEKISINRSINRDFGIDTMRVEYVDHNGNYKFKNIKRIESIKDLEKLMKLRIRGDQFNAIISNSNAKKITDNILEDLNQLKALKAKQAELNKANAQANKDLEIKQKRENELNLYSIPEALRNNEKLSDGLIALKKMFAKDYSDKGAYKYSIAKTHGIDENGFKNMLQENRRGLEKILNINPIKEFGTNYAEFYHDGSNAIKKLLVEKQGQVAGAFNKDGKDITLVLGIEGTSHSDGYGLAKIAKYHPEAVDKLDNIISKGEFYKDEKGRLNIKYNDDIVGLRENWLGNETAPWIISSYTKKVETSKGINSASSITPSKENYSFTTQHNNIIPQNSKEVNPTSNKVFANEHIGGGLVGGTLNGVETDENGNISFDPAKFALGFLAGAGGVAGIKRANKFLADNPQFKQAFKNEIAKTLSNGWENAKAKNPLLKTLETNSYIVPNEKGVSPEDVIKASQNLAKYDYHGINLKEQKSIKPVAEANSKITDTSIKAGEFAKPKGDSTYTKA